MDTKYGHDIERLIKQCEDRRNKFETDIITMRDKLKTSIDNLFDAIQTMLQPQIDNTDSTIESVVKQVKVLMQKSRKFDSVAEQVANLLQSLQSVEI